MSDSEDSKSQQEEANDPVLKYKPSNSFLLTKIFRVLVLKILGLLLKEKSLMLLISVVVVIFVKKQFKLNFNNYKQIVSFIK